MSDEINALKSSYEVGSGLRGRRLFIIGFTSPLGQSIASQAMSAGAQVIAVSRSNPADVKLNHSCTHVQVDLQMAGSLQRIGLSNGDTVICAASIRMLANAVSGVEVPLNVGITTVSSASAVTKIDSPFPRDARLSQELLAAESVITTAFSGNTRILRPTMIYGSGRDNNVAQIARLLARIHVFPLIGGGAGLRAPVHVDDLAQVALAAAAASPMSNPVHVPGGERLTFREVVRRIAIAANIRYIEIPMPSLPFALGGRYLANVGRLGGSLAACVRMSQDLTVPDDAALFGVHRRAFCPDAKAIGRAE
jgi:nucleoside-diphosphate-sugar epimerase